jgi:hypothetical protein
VLNQFPAEWHLRLSCNQVEKSVEDPMGAQFALGVNGPP